MSSLLTIIVVSVAAGIVSVAIFAACAWFIVIVAVGNGFGARSTLGNWETPIFILACLGVVLSLAICPAVAYFLRSLIFEITDSSVLRIFLLVGIAGFQIILIGTAYTSLQVYGAILERDRSHRTRTHRDILKQLAESDIRVSVERARILQDDGKQIKANVTLRIENVPPTFPYFEIYISKINNESGAFFIQPYLSYSPRLPKPWIKATNVDRSWHFQEAGTETLTSKSPNTITFDLNFERRRYATSEELPISITPTLLIRWKEFNSMIGDPTLNTAEMTFFERPIDIRFE